MQELFNPINFLFWIPFAWAQEVLECWCFKTGLFWVFFFVGWNMNDGNGSVILKFYRNLGFAWMMRFCARTGRKARGRCSVQAAGVTLLAGAQTHRCCSIRRRQGNGTRNLGMMLGLPCRAQLPFQVLGGCALSYLPAQQSLFFIPACASKAGAIP